MEEAILNQLELGEISPEARADMLQKIAEIYAAKLIEASAGTFTELELSRIEYLIEQNDQATLDHELRTHIGNPEAFLTQVANDTIRELRENMVALAEPKA